MACASGSFSGPAPGFLLMLLQLCLGIPSALENATGQGSRGMAVLAFPRVVVNAGPDDRFSISGAVVIIHDGVSSGGAVGAEWCGPD